MRVLVTGAASGLGAALVRAHLERGDTVVGVDMDAQGMKPLAQSHTDRFIGYRCDLADRDAVQRLPQRIEGAFNRVILNAGISSTGRFEDIPGDVHERILAVNTVAHVLLSNLLMERANKGGRFVFVSSLSHVTGYPGAASYAASKDAVAVYAKSIAKPLKRRGLGVTCIFPGPIRTTHAERHAPPGAKADRRMDPDDLAARIIKAADKGEAVLYPGAGALAAYALGAAAPRTMTRVMRKVIFEKLRGVSEP